MTPDPDRAARTIRRALAAAVVAAAAVLLILLVQHHRAGGGAATATAADDGDQARAHGWRRWFGGGAGRGVPPLPTWRLGGHVVDTANRPVPGATVHLARSTRISTSASDGSFAFDGLVAGAYDVEARLEDRVGGPVRAHVGSDGKPVTLRLYRGAVLEVEVVSAADERPIAGADVEVRVLHMHEGGGTLRGRTGADGKVRLPGAILIGSEAWAAAPGFAATLQPLDPSMQAGGRWHARIELPPGATFSGRVVDENGGPIAGAIVETAAAGGGGEARSTATDSRFGNVHPLAALVRREGVATDLNGNFRLALASGMWRLVATQDRHQTAVSDRLSSDGKSGRDGLVLVMKSGVRVAGHVLGSDGQPAAGALVRVRWQMNGRVEREVRADGDGHFVMFGLPPGLVSFQAEAERASSLPLHLDLEYAPKEELSLTLDNNGVITGTVTDEANNPLPDVDVVCVEHSTSMLTTRVHPFVETTDDAGRFAMHGLSPSATYSLNAKRAQDGDASFRVATVEAVPGQDVVLHVPGDGSVIGRVVRAGGGSLAEVTVELEDGGRAPRAVGGDGRFRIDNVFARAYTLRATASNAAFKNVPLTVSSGQVTDVGTIDLPRGRTLGGVVHRPDGTAAMGVSVTIAVAGDAETIGVSADAEGRFSAQVPADAALTVTANDRRLGKTEPLVVGASDAANAIELTFRPAGSVEGTLSAGGKPMGHRAVIALSDGGGATAQSAQSDESGYYRIDGLAPGSYVVQLAASDAVVGVKPQTVQIAAGARAFANFELPAP